MDFKPFIELRRKLHSSPEVSNHEVETANTIAQQLKSFEPDGLITGVGKRGILAIYNGISDGPTIVVRAELDALPIHEINEFEHRSKYPGVGHKCGHDGHMSTLVALAAMLHDKRPERGRVVLLFQPAEETGDGARDMTNDSKFTDLKPDYVVALHNLPGYPLGSVILKKGAFTTSVKSIVIWFKGRTSHAAEPENGINPALPIAEILQRTTKLSNNDVDRDDFANVTPIHIDMGSIDYGISAGQGVLRLTYRTWTAAEMEKLQENIINIVHDVREKHNIDVSYEFTAEFDTNKNNSDVIDWVEKAAEDNKLEIIYRDYPMKFGEDFGTFTQKYPGAMFGLGAGEATPVLHAPDYDFPDELIEIGSKLFSTIIKTIAEN